MKIILTAVVDNLGRPGEVVNVASGYARNYLIPRDLALLATPGNMKVVAQRKRRFDETELKQREAAEALAQKLAQISITIKKKAGDKGVLYGAVTNSEIAAELKSAGVDLDKRRIGVETPIKEIGEYDLPIRIHSDVTGVLKLHVEGE